MPTCTTIREQIALEPATNDAAVKTHLQTCAACTAYARRHRAIDRVIGAEMQWEAPAALTAALLAMTLAPASAIAPQPKRWHVALAYLVTAASIALSLFVGWQVLTLLAANFDLQAQFAQLVALPGRWLTQLTQDLPQSRYVIDFLLRARSQLVWLLLVALVWATLDTWNPQFKFSLRRRQGA